MRYQYIGHTSVKVLFSYQSSTLWYLSIIQDSHRAELATGYVDHHFVLQTAANPTWCWLIGSRPRSYLARVVVAPRIHLVTDEKKKVHSPKKNTD